MSMLRRHSTKSRKDLERRKSTSSVRSVHLEHFDAATAQRDAHIAATQAFARNQERHTAEMPLFQLNVPSPRRTNASTTTSSSFRASRNRALTDPPENWDEEDLQRRHSVRFVGPATEKRRLSCRRSSEIAGRSSNDHTERKSESSTRNTLDTAPASRVLQSSQNTQNQMPSYDQAGPATSKIASSFIHALAAGEDYYTPEDDIASMPSSYRRLRRSKSMFSHGISDDGNVAMEPPHLFSSTISHRAKLPASFTSPGTLGSTTAKENVYPNNTRMVHSLRAPKSMSFLRRRGRSEPTELRHFEAYTPWAGLQIGEPSVSAQPSLRQHSSFFTWSKNKKSESGAIGIRKSLRSSSTSSGVPVSQPPSSFAPATDGTLRKRARQASKSFKSRFKGLFRSSKSETSSTGIPEQHIEAQHTHVTTEVGTLPPTREVSPADECSNVCGQVAHQASPSLHHAPSHPTLRSHQASMESLRADTDEKSRVTSWTSSNPTTDTVFHDAKSEWERQRLSVINEGGAHCPSRSAFHSEASTDASVLRKGSFQPQRPAPMPPGGIVDSQRIYSALMKRAANGPSQTQQDGSQIERPSSTLSDPFRTASPGSSTVQSRMALMDPIMTSPLTIRCVPSSTKKLNELEHSPWADEEQSTEVDHGWAKGVGIASPRRDVKEEGQQPIVRSFMSPPSPESPDFVTAVDATGRSPFVDPPTLSTSPLLAQGVPDGASGFFRSPSPTNHLFRTTSPYRRALRASMKAAGSTDHSDAYHQAAPSLVNDANDTHGIDGHSDRRDSVYSESVYSYQTGDERMNTMPNGNAESVAKIHCDESPTRGLQRASSVSSEEWKSWLADNKSKLEPQFTPGHYEQILDDSPTRRESRIFGLGHVREREQICPDDDQDPFQPTAPIHWMRGTPMRTSGNTMWPDLTVPQSLPRNITQAELPREKSPIRPLSLLRGPAGPPPPIPPKSARRFATSSSVPKIPVTQLYNIPTTVTEKPHTPEPRVAARRAQSLARMRSLSRLRATTTGTGSPYAPLSSSATHANARNLMSSSGTPLLPSGTSSPGLSAAVERQFGATLPVAGRQFVDDKENSPRTETMGSGSKAMVDNFLRSRRRGVAGEVNEEEGEGSGHMEAFI